MNTTFWINSEMMRENLMKVTVYAQDVPANLFGVSFHLKFADGDWSYDRSEVGAVFAAEPMQLVKQDADRLVVGVSLRRGDALQARDGDLMVFYVRADELGEIGFENGVASVFEDGRMDLENVVWQGNEMVFEESGIGVPANEVLSSENVKIESEDPVLQFKANGSEALMISGFDDGQVSLLRDDNSLVDIYLFLCFSFFIVLFVLGGWLVVKYNYEIRSFFGKNR